MKKSKVRNWHAVNAFQRHAGPMKDKEEQFSEEQELNYQIQSIVDTISEVLGEEKAKLWMTAKNPLLGNQTPLEMLSLGRYNKLVEFINTQLRENDVDC